MSQPTRRESDIAPSSNNHSSNQSNDHSHNLFVNPSLDPPIDHPQEIDTSRDQARSHIQSHYESIIQSISSDSSSQAASEDSQSSSSMSDNPFGSRLIHQANHIINRHADNQPDDQPINMSILPSINPSTNPLNHHSMSQSSTSPPLGSRSPSPSIVHPTRTDGGVLNQTINQTIKAHSGLLGRDLAALKSQAPTKLIKLAGQSTVSTTSQSALRWRIAQREGGNNEAINQASDQINSQSNKRKSNSPSVSQSDESFSSNHSADHSNGHRSSDRVNRSTVNHVLDGHIQDGDNVHSDNHSDGHSDHQSNDESNNHLTNHKRQHSTLTSDEEQSVSQSSNHTNKKQHRQQNSVDGWYDHLKFNQIARSIQSRRLSPQSNSQSSNQQLSPQSLNQSSDHLNNIPDNQEGNLQLSPQATNQPINQSMTPPSINQSNNPLMTPPSHSYSDNQSMNSVSSNPLSNRSNDQSADSSSDIRPMDRPASMGESPMSMSATSQQSMSPPSSSQSVDQSNHVFFSPVDPALHQSGQHPVTPPLMPNNQSINQLIGQSNLTPGSDSSASSGSSMSISSDQLVNPLSDQSIHSSDNLSEPDDLSVRSLSLASDQPLAQTSSTDRRPSQTPLDLSAAQPVTQFSTQRLSPLRYVYHHRNPNQDIDQTMFSSQHSPFFQLDKLSTCTILSFLSLRQLVKTRSTCRVVNFYTYEPLVWANNQHSLSIRSVERFRSITFKSVSHLRELDLHGCSKLTDVDLETITVCESLNLLDLSYCTAVSDGLIDRIVNNCKWMEIFSVEGCSQLSNVIMESISRWEHLHSLSLSFIDLTDDGMRPVRANKSLEFLQLCYCTKISGGTLEHLVDLPVLNNLNLGHTKLVDRDFASFARFPSLTALNLEAVEVGDVGLSYIADLHLTSLNIHEVTRFTDVTLQIICRMTSLEELYMSFNDNITDHGLVEIISLTDTLRVLEMPHCQMITDRSMESIAQCGLLETLDITECELMTDRSIWMICDGLKDLRLLNIGFWPLLTDDGLVRLSALRHLISLELNSCFELTSVAAGYLRGLNSLTTLSVSDCVMMDDYAADALSTLPSLDALCVSGTSISLEGVKKLSMMRSIRELNCYNCGLDENELKIIQKTVRHRLALNFN